MLPNARCHSMNCALAGAGTRYVRTAVSVVLLCGKFGLFDYALWKVLYVYYWINDHNVLSFTH